MFKWGGEQGNGMGERRERNKTEEKNEDKLLQIEKERRVAGRSG